MELCTKKSVFYQRIRGTSIIRDFVGLTGVCLAGCATNLQRLPLLINILNYGATHLITATFFDRLGFLSLGMLSFTTYIAVLGVALITVTRAQYDASLVGTWSTKSKAVSTGPVSVPPLQESFYILTLSLGLL